MLRRMNIMGVCIALLFLVATPIQQAVQRDIGSPQVQAILTASATRGALATQTILSYVQRTGVTFVNGKPVIGRSAALDTSDNWSLNHGCSLSAEEVEAVLKAYNSPAAGGKVALASVDYCKRYGIDNAYWLAQFIHESSAGTAGAAVETANTGNVICISGYACKGRFADMQGDWVKGTELHFRLLRCYRDGGGTDCGGLWTGKKHETIVDAIYTWAPPSENNQNQDCAADPGSYPCAVKAMVSNWRSAHKAVATTDGNELRQRVIDKMLSLRGTAYSQAYDGRLGFRPDCSGTVAFVYKDVTGLNIGSTTYDIFPNLKPVDEAHLQPGDIWFGKWEGVSPPNDEHMGIVADVNGDGVWDLIHNGADQSEVHVTESFLTTYLGQHTKGFRTVLGE